MLLYLHGFRSSPQSFKSRLVQERMRAGAWRNISPAPRSMSRRSEPSPRPRPAIRGARAGGETDIAIIGSSLGGFYARWLAERHGCRAVLLNPAIHPWTDLEKYLGEQPLYHGGGSVVVERSYLQELLEPACRTDHQAGALLPAGRRAATRCWTIARWSKPARAPTSASSKAATTASPSSRTTWTTCSPSAAGPGGKLPASSRPDPA